MSVTRTTWYLLDFQKLISLVLSWLYLHFIRILLSLIEIALEELLVAGELLELLI